MPFITIERHIHEQQRKFPTATGVFSSLLTDIALAAKIIANEMAHAGLNTILGATEEVNTHGEVQQKLDVFADNTIVDVCGATGRLCAMASEEREDIVVLPTQVSSGKYVLVYDPLDGSSNINANVSTGTLFAIYRRKPSASRVSDTATVDDVLQAGVHIVAAGYVIYGPSTMLIYSAGQGVFGFTLNPSLGEFLLSYENFKIPESPRYYSVNQGNEKYWTKGIRAYLRWLQALGSTKRKPLAARYTGSLVMDFHRILLYGGVYFYPYDKATTQAKGKLRLVYEAAPLAFLAEQANGYASDGRQRVLDIQPAGLHQRLPLFIGNRRLVERAEKFVAKYDHE